MPDYTSIQKEETIKARVFQDYFEPLRYGYEPNIDNIDFVISEPAPPGQGLLDQRLHFLWAEAKRGIEDTVAMLTQLILTCKKTYEKGDYNPPPYIGCFDAVKIAFVPFRDILPIFKENDFNWNIAPSNHDGPDFIKARAKVLPLIAKNLIEFRFDSDRREIQDFIKTSLYRASPSAKIYITADNFVHVYLRWVKEVKPTINISKDEWLSFKKAGVLDCDFYRADLMSKEGTTITEKLKIVLKNDKYKLQEVMRGRLFQSDIDFTDGGGAYTRFWNKYQRPPLEEFQAHIIDRRDLLVPQNIREIKGSFFTPPQWVKKSQEYLEKVFGADWQDEYYIWDCAAGTGNLLAGLANEYNIWASTLDNPDVDSMKALLGDAGDTGGRVFNLLEDHIFQFDFLNDKFDKLPQGLRDIIDDPEKRKRLIVYINPPYAEATNARTAAGTGKNRDRVAAGNRTKDAYERLIGAATNELFTHFFTHIYHEIPGCKLAAFSTFKFVCAGHFVRFRKYFRAEFKAGFAVHADTFDNVRGQFPIGFTIWDLNGKPFPKSIRVALPETGGSKRFWDGFDKSINRWIKQYDNKSVPGIGFMGNYAPDFQVINQPYLEIQKGTRHVNYFSFNESNLIEGCIYFAVRLAITKTWLNASDQFYYPQKDGWQTDTEFQHNCLVFTLFHGKNYISCNDDETQDGAACVNHWIPFTEKEAGARDKFQSNFMSRFLKERGIGNREQGTGFSSEALDVYKSGLELWKYYHRIIKANKTASVDASFYDIREFFQGRAENGKKKMNNRSGDETYNALVKTLRDSLKTLAAHIAPKVYEYGFLKE